MGSMTKTTEGWVYRFLRKFVAEDDLMYDKYAKDRIIEFFRNEFKRERQEGYKEGVADAKRVIVKMQGLANEVKIHKSTEKMK
jgi:hypothetical protein